MFYCSEILNQRRGQFAIIWLAATRGRKLTRRDFNNVNIVKSCDAIITYLFATSSKKRLSLYLSTQLMYGTLLIYKKQQDHLLDDVSNLMTKFHKSVSKEVEINLKMSIRREQVTKSNIMDEIKPGFGELSESESLSVSEIPDVDVWKSIISPEIPRHSPILMTTTSDKLMQSLPASPSTGDLTKYKPEYIPGSSQRLDITLKEISIEKPVEPPIQPELPELNYLDLQMIAEQPIAELEIPQVPKTPEKIPISEPVQQTPKHSLPDQVTPGAPERHKHKTVDPDLTQEKPEAPQKKRPRIPQMILSPVVSSNGRVRKRRLMVDLETSLSRDSIRRNLAHTSDTVRKITDSRIPHDTMFKSTVKELFKHPLKKEFNHKSLFPLWSRNLRAVSEFSETESERRQPIFSVPELLLSSTSGSSVSGSERAQERPRRRSTPHSEVLLPTETVRLGESIASDREMTPISVKLGKSADSIHGSMSKKKKRKTDSQSLTQSISEEELTQIIEDPIVRRLEDELYPLPEEVPMDLSKVSLSPVKHIPEMIPPSEFMVIHLLEAVEKHTLDQHWTTFKEICPLHTPRNRAAVVFYTLLVAHKENYISLKQEEPYRDILIRLR